MSRYFDNPPKFQILHCLVNRVVGGSSIFVDAFERAYKLREVDRAAFDLLTRSPVNFHYDNDGHFHHCAHPTIELNTFPGPDGEHSIKHINYSPPFQAPFPLDTSPELWRALALYTDLLDEPRGRFEYTLREGDAVLFDNRRVLHARTAFTNRPGNENSLETSRWLKGCYLEADPLFDKARMLRRELESN